MSNPLGNAITEISDAVVKPTVDEVGKMVESGVGSISGSNMKPVDPQEEAKKKMEEQRKLQVAQANVERIIAAQNLYNQQKVQEVQKENLKTQEEDKKIQVQQFEVSKRQDSLAVARAKKTTEAKVGQGAGG